MVLLALTACASLPEYTAMRRFDASPTPLQFAGQNGLLSHARSEAILRNLQKQGNSSLLDRHLAFMQAIDRNPPVTGRY